MLSQIPDNTLTSKVCKWAETEETPGASKKKTLLIRGLVRIQTRVRGNDIRVKELTTLPSLCQATVETQTEGLLNPFTNHKLGQIQYKPNTIHFQKVGFGVLS